jgi:type I restriction enzyme, S subunit
VSFDKADCASHPKPDHLPFLRAGNISDRLNTNNDLQWVRETKVQPEQRLSVGDLVICTSSGSASVVGKSARLEDSWNGTVGAFLGIIRPTSIDSRYLGHWFKSPDFFAWRNRRAQGANIQNLRLSEIGDLPVPIPDIAEQRRVADRLDKAMAEISAAKSALKRQEIEIEAVQTRAAQEQFSGCPPVPMVEIIADTRNGLYKPDGFYGAGTPILKMFNIDRFANRITTERLDRLEATEQERKKGELRSGDILVNRVNSRELVGKCACICPEHEGFLFESKNLRLSVRSDKADPMYVALWLNSADARHQITDRLKQIAGMATISRPDLDALQIPLPSLAEQQRAVKEMTRVRETADSVRSGLAAQSAALDALPASLLSAAFRGEL